MFGQICIWLFCLYRVAECRLKHSQKHVRTSIRTGEVNVPLYHSGHEEASSLAAVRGELYSRLKSHHESLEAMNDEKNDEHSSALVEMKQGESQLWGTILVGTPPRPFHVIFDTGSTNSWINSVECHSATCLRHHPRQYDAHKSFSFAQVENGWHGRVNFVTGSLTGGQVMDTFSLGNNINVKNQVFNQVEDMDGDMFEHTFKDFEGIVGFAFPEMAAAGAISFFENVMNQKVLNNNCFSFFYNRNPSQPGFVNFGNANGDTRLYDGKMQHFPVVDPYYWQLALEGFYIGDKRMYGPGSLVVDSGTTFFGAPTSVAQQVLRYHRSMGSFQQVDQPDMTWRFRIYCNAPSNAFQAGSKTNVEPLNWCDEENENDWVDLTFDPADYTLEDGESLALMSIELPKDPPPMVFGQVPGEKYYTNFNFGTKSPSVGFALAKKNPNIDALHQEAKKMHTDFSQR